MTPALYRGATALLGPAIDALLRRRLRRGKEDAARFDERLGRPARPRPPGLLVWFHAASVGEAVSVLPLIERLLARRADLSVLVTSGTVTSAGLLQQRLPPRALHQYVPIDRAAAVRGFLDHWHPDLGVWVESELWPNLVGEAHRRGMPMLLVNARMSARAFRRWRRLPFMVRPLLRAFDAVLAQSEADAERFAALGAAPVECPGNLKNAAPPLGCDEAALERLRGEIGERPCWLAASTHPGEEAIAAEVHAALKPRLPDLLTVIVPRHPERGAEIAAELRGRGLAVARRSQDERPGPDCEIYLGDSMGEMGLYYRLAGIVFVGGSLVRHGGQNPLEPARLGCALLFGPHLWNFAEARAALLEAGAAHEVGDAAALADAVAGLLADPAECRRRAGAALGVANRDAEVLERVLDRLLAALPAEAA